MAIGNNIRKIRISKELSQEAVVRNCAVKISQSTLSKIENGQQEITPDSPVLAAIAAVLGWSVQDIIDYHNGQVPTPDFDGQDAASAISSVVLDPSALLNHTDLLPFLERHYALLGQAIDQLKKK